MPAGLGLAELDAFTIIEVGLADGSASARARRARGVLTVTVRTLVAVSALLIVDVKMLVSVFVLVTTLRLVSITLR